MKKPGSVKSLEELGRFRLSKNFFMRDGSGKYGVKSEPQALCSKGDMAKSLLLHHYLPSLV